MTRSSPVQMAAEWLYGYLRNRGEVPVSTIVKGAEQVGLARSTLYRAASRLPITCRTGGFPRQSWWKLATASRSTDTTETAETIETTYRPQPGVEILDPGSPAVLNHWMVMLGARSGA